MIEELHDLPDGVIGFEGWPTRQTSTLGQAYWLTVQMNQPTNVQGTTTMASAPIAAHP